MAHAQKKVIVRRFAGDTLAGYLPVAGVVRGWTGLDGGQAGVVDLLDLAGRVVPVGLGEIKMVSYVREFNLGDGVNPERLLRRTFLARPRAEGLWLRLTFRGGEVLEGLAAADLSLLTAAGEDAGVYLTPPDTRSNTQRIFVPRGALEALQVVAVITTPSRRKPLPEPERPSLQETLFAELPPSPRPN